MIDTPRSQVETRGWCVTPHHILHDHNSEIDLYSVRKAGALVLQLNPAPVLDLGNLPLNLCFDVRVPKSNYGVGPRISDVPQAVRLFLRYRPSGAINYNCAGAGRRPSALSP